MCCVSEAETQNHPHKIHHSYLRVHIMDTKVVLVTGVDWHMPISAHNTNTRF